MPESRIIRKVTVMTDNFRWFALRVRSRFEKQTAADLANRGYEACSACAPQRRVWADRIRTVEMPAFPGYIFARFDASQGPEVLKVPGIVSIVGFGSRYCPVEDSEMEALQIVLRSGVEVEQEMLHPGARVRVCYGPLRDLEGVLVEVKNRHRLVVSVGLLNRSVAVEVDSALIESLSPRTVQGVAA
jgi:transcription antitermination factor NusG